MTTRIVTAEADEGRRAIEEVMDHSYCTDIEGVPPQWAGALGHTSAGALVEILGTPLPLEPLAMLDTLFPRWWRLSRNEEWVFAA